MSIDLNFRPKSYVDFDDPVALAVNGIQGQLRREMVRDMLTAEGEKRALQEELLGPIEEGILDEHVDESFVSNLTQFWGPSWMGGEYLPKFRRGEEEIARIVLQSTTMDVHSIRARWVKDHYHYRVVDEYGTDYALPWETSTETLTLQELIELVETTVVTGRDMSEEGLLRAHWDFCWAYEGTDPRRCVEFARIESELYPGLEKWYRLQAAQWIKERLSEVEDDD